MDDAPPFDPVRRTSLLIHHPVRVDPRGQTGPTRGQAAGPRWRRVGSGLYVPADVEGTRPEQRAAEALAAVSGEATLTGWAALYMAGGAFFDGRRRDGTSRPVQVVVGPGPGRRTPRGVVLSYEVTPPSEVMEAGGLPVVTPERAVFDELRRPPHDREGVVAADMALASELVWFRELREYVVARSTWRRASWAARALEHASHRSRSPQETRLRLIWTLDAGLPTPLLNQPVFTLDGDFVCLADLLDPEAGLVVEFDGAEHRKAERHAGDVARTERVRDVGLEITSVTGRDIDQRRLVVRRLLSARSRALFLPESRRRWTLETPDSWVAPTTLPAYSRLAESSPTPRRLA